MAETYTQSDIDELKAALLSGRRSVTFGDQTVTFASMADLEAALDRVQRVMARESSDFASPAYPRSSGGW